MKKKHRAIKYIAIIATVLLVMIIYVALRLMFHFDENGITPMVVGCLSAFAVYKIKHSGHELTEFNDSEIENRDEKQK